MANKFDYYKVIQQDCGFGWEDVSFYPCDSTGYMCRKARTVMNGDILEYRTFGYPTRVILRREKVNQINKQTI